MGTGSQRTGERYIGLHTKGNAKAGSLLSEDFLTFSFKVTPCNRKYPHDWASCLCGHKGERATRRDLRAHHYLPIACKYAKQRLECPQGDSCPHSHNLFEYWLHPKRFRTELCLFRANCDRPVCFFAHSSEELRPLQDGLPPAELCWSAGAAISSKLRSAAGPRGKSPQQAEYRQQHQQAALQQQQQHQHQQQQQQQQAMHEHLQRQQQQQVALQQQHQQQQQQAMHGHLQVPASVPLQQQQQAHPYMQLPGYAAVSSGQVGSAVGLDMIGSQPLLVHQQLQQQQQQIVTLAPANQNLSVTPMLPGSSMPAVAGAAPQMMSAGGLAGAPMISSLAGSDMLAAAGTAYAWQQHQQQLQQVQLGLGNAGLHHSAGLLMMPAADSSMQGCGVDGLGMGGHTAAAGHMTGALPLAAAAAANSPSASPGQLLSQQGIVLPAGVLPTGGGSSGTDACGNELTGLMAATPSSCSSASSSSNMLGMLVAGQGAAGLQSGLPVSQAAVHYATVGLHGMQLHRSGQLHVSGDMSQIMQQFRSMHLAVTQS